MSEQTLRVIVNADDLGISDDVNQAMVQWASEGLITSVSAMGAAPAQDPKAAAALADVGVSIGVHCNLSQFRPLTTEIGLAPLLKSDGTFDTVVRSIKPTAGLRSAVEIELLAQIDSVRALGVEPTHLDSHHHDHFVAWMMRVYRQLRLETGINRVRGPLTGTEVGGRRAQFVRRRARDVQRHVFGFSTPDAFVDLAYLGENGIEELRRFSGTVEVMTHPGADSTTTGERRAAEQIRDASWIKLVNYRAVG